MIVVDVGCGNHCRGDICIDIDATPSSGSPHLDDVVGFRRRDDGMFVVGDAMNLPLRSGVADVVLMIHVLEHLECPARGLREASRVLRSGGTIIVEVPNPLCNDADWKDRTHLYSFTVASLLNLLNRIGFERCEVRQVYGCIDIQARCVK